MPHISGSDYHEGATVSLRPFTVPTSAPCESIHILFSLLMNTLLASLLSLYGNSLLRNQWARALSLATGLVARIQHSHHRSLTSISGRDSESCFKLPQVEATQDQTDPCSLQTRVSTCFYLSCLHLSLGLALRTEIYREVG